MRCKRSGRNLACNLRPERVDLLSKANSGDGIIFEFVAMGGSVKVSAIDARTGREVSIVGPAKASRLELERTAANKLKFVMNRDAGKGL